MRLTRACANGDAVTAALEIRDLTVSLGQPGGAALHYLKAVKATGTDEPAAVLEKMRETKINDFMTKDGWIREDGRVMREMYLAQVRGPEESKGPFDYYKILASIPAEEAFRSLDITECPHVKK